MKENGLLLTGKTSMKLDVPYYSQRLDVKRKFWKSRSCGIVALKMAMDFLGRSKKAYRQKSADDLINEGISFGGHSLAHGWYHDALLRIAKKRGFKKSFRKEWPENKKEKGVKFILGLLKQEVPVLASLKIGQSGHLVLLAGFTGKGLFYHDPDFKIRSKGKYRYVSFKNFLPKWKGRIVIIR